MTPLFKKLNLKDHKNVLALHAPSTFEAELAQIEDVVTVYRGLDAAERVDFAIVFATKQHEIDGAIARLFPKMSGDAILWFCYPKGSSKKYKCDFNRDTGWSSLGQYGIEPVRQVAIDEDWSALRFRKVEYIKTMTRQAGHALSEEGKNRTEKNVNT
jgi:hypothetical protein